MEIFGISNQFFYTLNCALLSNLNVEQNQMKNFIPFRALRNLIDTARKLDKCTSLCRAAVRDKQNLFGLNNLLRYRRKAIFNEEFVNAGIFWFRSHNSDGELMQYDSIAQKFDLTANNVLFIQFITSANSLVMGRANNLSIARQWPPLQQNENQFERRWFFC